MLSDKRKELLFKAFINKELEPHGLTYEDILKIPDWFIKYTTTEKESKEWIEWCVKKLRKNGMSKKQAVKEVQWFDLMYGLRII